MSEPLDAAARDARAHRRYATSVRAQDLAADRETSLEVKGQRGPKNAYGFDLHAQARAAAKDEQARERLCRYLLRPPWSRDRLARTADGRYRIILKRAWDDGTTAVVVSGQELLARLALLVPPPRVHTIRYFGVWAPRSRLRRLVVPRIAAPAATAAHGHGATDAAAGSPSARLDEGERGGRYRLSWAATLAAIDGGTGRVAPP